MSSAVWTFPVCFPSFFAHFPSGVSHMPLDIWTTFDLHESDTALHIGMEIALQILLLISNYNPHSRLEHSILEDFRSSTVVVFRFSNQLKLSFVYDDFLFKRILEDVVYFFAVFKISDQFCHKIVQLLFQKDSVFRLLSRSSGDQNSLSFYASNWSNLTLADPDK